MGSKIAGSASRGDSYRFDPDFLVLVEDKAHALYDERVHIEPGEALLRSIRAHGVVVPISVRKNGKRKDGTDIVEVCDGRQRVRAARIINEERRQHGGLIIRVEGIYRKEDDLAAMSTMITTNEIRRGDDVVTRAEKLKRVLDAGISQDEAATMFGLDDNGLAKLLRVLDLDKSAKTALREGKITATLAQKLVVLPRAEQAQVVERVLEAGGKKHAATRVVEKARGPRVRSRKQIEAKLEELKAELQGPAKQAVLAFGAWVLGGKG